MKSLIFLLIISSIFTRFTDSGLFTKFQQFIEKYNKHYDSIEEYLERFYIFKNHLFSLQNNNENESLHHTIGITKFSDLTDEEFRKKYLGLKINKSNVNFKKVTLKKDLKLPESFDWVTEKNV